MNQSIVKNALMNAFAAALYITAVATFLSHAEKILGPDPVEKTAFIPMFMLSLLVVSAAVTGFAVFGRPAMWYLDGKKKEALALLAATLGFLAGITAIFGVLVAVLR